MNKAIQTFVYWFPFGNEFRLSGRKQRPLNSALSKKYECTGLKPTFKRVLFAQPEMSDF
jgi:hypothetical protein